MTLVGKTPQQTLLFGLYQEPTATARGMDILGCMRSGSREGGRGAESTPGPDRKLDGGAEVLGFQLEGWVGDKL